MCAGIPAGIPQLDTTGYKYIAVKYLSGCAGGGGGGSSSSSRRSKVAETGAEATAL